MVNNTPLVSIIMNCHNGEKYLKDALDSVFIQSYTNWELIFWDNISNDNTEKIVFSYKDSRVRYFKSKIFSSLPIARNNALCRANGEFICFLDVDDYWEADKIERQLNGFINSKIGLSYAKDSCDSNTTLYFSGKTYPFLFPNTLQNMIDDASYNPDVYIVLN